MYRKSMSRGHARKNFHSGTDVKSRNFVTGLRGGIRL